MSDLLKTIGLTKDELTNLVVEKIADEADKCYGMDLATVAKNQLHERLKSDIDKAIDGVAKTQTIPALMAIINEMMVTPTKEWGYKTNREAMTLKQYVEFSMSRYLRQEVSSDGKYTYDRYGDGMNSRAAFFIKSYMDEHIKELVSDSLKAFDGKLKEISDQCHKTFLNSVNEAFSNRYGYK